MHYLNRRMAGTLVFLALLLTAVSACGAGDDVGEGFDPDPGPIDPTPNTTVVLKQGISDAAIGALVDRYGVSRDEAIRQLELQPAIGQLRLKVIADETFAGMWIGHQPFGVNIAFTGDAEGKVDALRSGFVAGDELVAVQATYTFNQLSEVRDELKVARDEGVDGLEPLRGVLFDINVDEKTNQVVVVSESTTVEAAILAYFPADQVTVRFGATTTTILD